MRIVITGANRGIGLELTRQLLAKGNQVVVGVRDPEKATKLRELERAHGQALSIRPLDVSDDSSVATFAKGVDGSVDVLINNAGVMGDSHSLQELDFDNALKTLSVNALGPLRVTRALLPQLRKSNVKKVLHVTSGMGSISDNQSGGSYDYRMSKAALNMASRSLSVDLKPEGILSAVINPGWVKTDMGGKGAPTTVEESAEGILRQLEELSPSKSGEFLDYKGKQWAW